MADQIVVVNFEMGSFIGYYAMPNGLLSMSAS